MTPPGAIRVRLQPGIRRDANTEGLVITDFIENKTGKQFVKAFDVPIKVVDEIIAGTSLDKATIFSYSVDAAPLSGTIRNNASLTITNHSGSLGTPFGPNPKATYTGTIPPPACTPAPAGCTLTQGYWGNKPGVIWPDPFSRTATFFLSEQTWQQVLDTPVNDSPGYYQLAHQYIAAVLNQANGASIPSGVQDTLNLATPWFEANGIGACTANGSCDLQKVWSGTLATFNEGTYPGGPKHCDGQEAPVLSPQGYVTSGWKLSLFLPSILSK